MILFHVKRDLRRRITTTVVGEMSRPTPHNTTCPSAPPNRSIAARCSASSVAACRPLSANRNPPWSRSGRHHAGQAVQRGHGSSRDPIGRRHVAGYRGLLGPTPNDSDPRRQPQRGHRLLEEGDPTNQGLDERDPQVWSGTGQGQSRQPRTAADVDDTGGRRQQLSDDRAVQQVPIPYSFRLAGTEQSALHTRGREQGGIANSQRQRGPEDPRGFRRRFRVAERPSLTVY